MKIASHRAKMNIFRQPFALDDDVQNVSFFFGRARAYYKTDAEDVVALCEPRGMII